LEGGETFVMSTYNEILELAGGDPRTLASAAADPEVAAWLGLNYPLGSAAPNSARLTYEERFELVGRDPRALASAAADPEVAALLGLTF